MRFPFALASVLVLFCAACSPDQKDATLKQCVETATRENPPQQGQSAEEVHDAIGSDVADCMKAAGYRHDEADGKCIDDVDFNRYCYVKRRS